MVFGCMVVQRLLVLVRVFSRLPDGVSRVFARRLSAAITPFNIINYYGSCAAALVYNRHRMGAKMDGVIASLQRKLARESDDSLRRGMHFPDTVGPVLQGLHDVGRRLSLPRQAFRLPQAAADLNSSAAAWMP